MTTPNHPMVSLSYPEPLNPTIRYGAQPPELGGLTNLILMKDKDSSYRGPAYLFTQQYNKTVIIHSSDLPGGLPNTKRSLIERLLSREYFKGPAGPHRRDEYDDSQWTSNSIAEPADKPWYCYWPGTVLEGFIFVTQDAAQSASGSGANYAAATTIPPPSASSQTVEKRKAPPNLAPYPKVVKVEERRNPFNPVKPYCQQMQISNNNQPGPLTDPANGQLIQIQLDESEPLAQHQFDQHNYFGPAASSDMPPTPASPTGLPSRRRAADKRSPSDSTPSCQCEWMSA